MDFTVRVTVSRRRRRPALRAVSKHEVEILSPVRLSSGEIDRIVKRHEKVILKLLGAFHEKPVDFSDGAEFLYRGRPYPIRKTIRMTGVDDAFLLPDGDRPGALEKIYRKLAAAYIVERAQNLAAKFAVTIGKVKISGARRRFGSCSSNGNCNFSWRLIQYPDDLIDYVICHELAHRFHMDHSAAFYRALERFYPGAAAKRQAMREYGKRENLI